MSEKIPTQHKTEETEINNPVESGDSLQEKTNKAEDACNYLDKMSSSLGVLTEGYRGVPGVPGMLKVIDTSILEIKKDLELFVSENNIKISELTSKVENLQKEKKELQEKVDSAEKEARIDHLTGLPNRRAFDEEINKIVSINSRTKRNKGTIQPFFVVSFDLDGFKAINDTYGHGAGDLYLKRITNKLREAFSRGSDTLARVGGDEFSLLMPDENNIDINLEHIRRAVFEGSSEARSEIEKENGSIPDDSGNVSASIGYTAFDEQNDTNAKDIEARADYALYVVKEAGKNAALSDREALEEYDTNKELYEQFLVEKNKA